MKKLLYILSIISIGISSCQKETKTGTIETEVKIDTTLENSVWVNSKYLETIERTKSPLKASAFADTALINFNAKADTASIVWNYHEGSQYLIKRDKLIQFYNTYEIKNTPEMSGILMNGKLKLGNSNFSRVDTIGFFEKKYWLGKHTQKGKSIELLSDGTITGIDSLSSFYVWNDYITTQTDIDLVDFTAKSKNAKTYGYKIIGNEIIFYDFKWNEDGIIGKAGKELFRWKKP